MSSVISCHFSCKYLDSSNDICSDMRKYNFVTKIVLTYCQKNCFSDQEEFEAEGREFAKILRSLEQFIQTMKGPNNFW